MFGFIKRIWCEFYHWMSDVGNAMGRKYGDDFLHDLEQFATRAVTEIMNDPKISNTSKRNIVFKKVKKHALSSAKGAVLDGDTGLDSMIMSIIHSALWVQKVIK